MKKYYFNLGLLLIFLVTILGCEKDSPKKNRGPYSFVISNKSSFELTDIYVFTKSFMVLNSIEKVCDIIEETPAVTITGKCTATIDRTIYDLSGEITNKTDKFSFYSADNFNSYLNDLREELDNDIVSIVYADTLVAHDSTDVLYSKYKNVMLSFKKADDKKTYTSMALYELNTKDEIHIEINDEMQVFSSGTSYTYLGGDSIPEGELELEWLVSPTGNRILY